MRNSTLSWKELYKSTTQRNGQGIEKKVRSSDCDFIRLIYEHWGKTTNFINICKFYNFCAFLIFKNSFYMFFFDTNSYFREEFGTKSGGFRIVASFATIF